MQLIWGHLWPQSSGVDRIFTGVETAEATATNMWEKKLDA
jgi:hypothetical protein